MEGDPVLSPGHKVADGKPSADALMWEFLTGGNKGNKVTVQRDPELGSPAKKIMTGPELATLGAAAVQTARENKP